MEDEGGADNGVTGAPAGESAVTGEAGGTAPSCPVCGESMGGPAVVACARCRTPHHRDCFRYNGTCAVFACGCQSFAPFAPEPSGLVLKLAERLAKFPRRRATAARHEAPAPAGAPAPAAAPASPAARQLVLDYLSTFELRARWLAAASFAILGLRMLTGPHPHGFDASDPVMLVSALGLVIGAVLSLSVEDLLVFEPGSRSILRDRSILGMRLVRKLHSFDEFVGVGTTGWSLEPSASAEGGPCISLFWLALVQRDGTPLVLGNPVTVADSCSHPGVQRLLDRAAAATGLPTRKVTVPASTIRRDRAIRARPLQIFWLLTTAFLGGFSFDLAQVSPLVLMPVFALVSLLVAAWTFWWLIERPAAFCDEPVPARPGVVRRALGLGGPRKKGSRAAREEAGFLILVLLALMALPWFSHMFFTSLRAMLHYSTTTCRVIKSGIAENRGRSTSYKVWVRFRYTAGGAVREQVGFGTTDFPFASRGSAEEALARFQPGADVPCWFDPAEPSTAVVDTSISWILCTLLLLDLILIRAGAASLVRRWGRQWPSMESIRASALVSSASR